VTPHERVFLGLLLGHVVSYYGLRLLHRRANAFGKAVAEKGKPPGLGTFFRLIGVAVAIGIALKWDHKFNLIAVILGLMTSHIVILIETFYSSIRQTREKEGK